LVAHLHFFNAEFQTKKCKRATKQTHQARPKWTDKPRPKKNNEGITAPKKNAGRSISFLPTSCRFAKVCYFYVGKKEYNISATN
jgi:hypothetical protein